MLTTYHRTMVVACSCCKVLTPESQSLSLWNAFSVLSQLSMFPRSMSPILSPVTSKHNMEMIKGQFIVLVDNFLLYHS